VPGIKDLREIYKKFGIKEIEKFIKGYVIITEKIDAYRFSFQVDDKNNKILFYKKNDKKPLDIIDRTITDLYEKAINHIEFIIKNFEIKKLPKNTRFGFYYFPTNKPLRISYKFNPKNNLIITDITLRNKKGKVKKIYENIKFLNKYADLFKVSKPPILFKGYLKQEQIKMILELIKENDIAKTFFTEHIEGIFGNTYTKNHIIEGIVIKNKNGLTQLKDPLFEIFDEAETPKINRDFYDLTLLQIKNFMENYKFPLNITERNPEERYLILISDAFNKFISENIIDKNIDPEFLKPKIIGVRGKLNKKFIKNKKTIELIKNPLNEELFKVFLNAFRKERKPYGLLTEKSIESFNNIVKKINEFTNFTVYTFKQFNDLYN